MPIYLDYNATTPVDKAVAEEMRPFIEGIFGNPSSIHEFGINAKLAVEKARTRVALFLGCNADEVIFTSGGTESNNYAIKGAAFANQERGNHIITSQIEHPAVIEVCKFLEGKGFTVSYLPVDESGKVNVNDLEQAIRPETILVTIMHANNEVGTIQPIAEIAGICKKYRILFHTDAAQSCGKIPTDVSDLGVDLLSVAGHKLYAPKGIGALYIKRGTRLEKLIHGADHEGNRRAGTENVIEIVGLGKACEIAKDSLQQEAGAQKSEVGGWKTEDGGWRIEDGDQKSEVRRLNIIELREGLYAGIKAAFPEVRLNGHPVDRLPNTLSLSFPGIEANRLLLEMSGIAASAGAACHSDRTDVSPVLTAMNVPILYAMGTIRFSVGRMTTVEEIDEAIAIIANAVEKLRRSRESEVGGRRSEVSGRNFEAASQKLVFGSQESVDRNQEIQSAVSQQSPAKVFEHLSSDLRPPTSIFHSPDTASEIKLTHYTHSLGCACKIRPQLLEKILREIPLSADPDVVVDQGTSDDAAVYRINDTTAIIQTVDIIPPIVDDPYSFGAIAAANSLSDVYAMGGTPLFALSVVAFPDKLLPIEVLQMIIKGATDKVMEAGISIIGGHTIEDTEPKFGLVVTGRADPSRIARNSTAQAGDMIILTKPIGTGILSTAAKRGLTDAPTLSKLIGVMSTLNGKASGIMMRFPVSACTDVTGFGLLGHLKEMTAGAGIGAEVYPDAVPLLPKVWELAGSGIVPGGTKSNLGFAGEVVDWPDNFHEIGKIILCDAQTSGGLMIAVAPQYAEELLDALQSGGVEDARIIGRFTEAPGRIFIKKNMNNHGIPL